MPMVNQSESWQSLVHDAVNKLRDKLATVREALKVVRDVTIGAAMRTNCISGM